MLTPEQQLFQSLERGRRTLITTRPDASVDGLAVCLALKEIAKGMNRDADVVIDNWQKNPQAAFLPGVDAVRSALGRLRKFVIALDISKTKLEELSYDMRDGKLNIFLLPKTGGWNPKDVTTGATEYHYDFAITVDCSDISALGDGYTNHLDFWQKVPVANIDNSSANEHYGHLNFVNMAASSASEILYDLIIAAKKPFLNSTVATHLLAGLISKTRSFETEKVTSKTLEIAGRLVAAGGKREEIVRHLYRTRSIGTLKLWGRALSRLKRDESAGAVWAALTRNDFIEAGSGEETLSDVVDELIVKIPEAKIIALLYEQERGGICALVRATKGGPPATLAGLGTPISQQPAQIKFCITGKSILEAEEQVIQAIKKSSVK